MPAPKERWLDQEAGPVVRPYALTKGRTEPTAGPPVGLIDIVLPAAGPPPPGARPGPEHRKILSLCRQPSTVVDLASAADLPVAVVRVLLSDLRELGLVRIHPAPSRPAADERMLREILDGLHAL
jgi:uncharacterized protein DUF742